MRGEEDRLMMGWLGVGEGEMDEEGVEEDW